MHHEYSDIAPRIHRRWLNTHLSKVVVGIILIVIALWNLKEIIAPGTALRTNRLNLTFKSDDCPSSLIPGHSFRLDENKAVTAELWFPAYDNSICKISVSALVPEGRSVLIEALRNSDSFQIPLSQARVDTVSDNLNYRYLRVSNDVPVAPNPKPPNPLPAVGPPPPGGPKILVHISNALTQRSFVKESLYINIRDILKFFDHFTDQKTFDESFGTMNLYYPLVFSLNSANFTYERLPDATGEVIYFIPKRVASNGGATTSLDIDFDDLIRTEKKDVSILVWGTILGAGVALLADGIANLISQPEPGPRRRRKIDVHDAS